MSNYKILTEKEYKNISNRREDLFFDKKGAKIKPVDLQRTVVAFANSEGGEICIGVDNNGKNDGPDNLSGFDDVVKDGVLGAIPTIQDLKYEFVCYGEAFLILIKIPKSEIVHATSKAEVYIRVGACNKKLNQDEIIALRYKKGELKFEEQIKNIEISAITDSNYLKEYIKRQRRIKSKPKDYLITNGFIFNNKPKVSSIICFHDRPQNILKCGIKIRQFL